MLKKIIMSWYVMVRIAKPLLVMLLMASYASAREPWLRHTIDNSSQGADGVRLADVNQDGLPDLVTPWEEGGMVRVYIHPGPKRAKQPWPHVRVGKVASPEDAVFVDLDADGAMDVVSSCEGAIKTMFVHWAPRSPENYLKEAMWRTRPIPATEGEQAWMFALPQDIDGRHGVDLVVSSKGPAASVGWLEAPQDARDLRRWKYHRLIDAGWIMSLIDADINRDGFGDILLSDRRGVARGIKWLAHPGRVPISTGSARAMHPIGGGEHEVMFIDYADVNDDGRKDVVAATHQREILVLQSDGKNAWHTTTLPAPFQARKGKSVRVGDIDLDGVVDLVHSTEPNPQPRGPGITWLQGPLTRGNQPAVHPISDLEGSKFDLLQLIDIDRDGDLDVLTCEERDNLGVIWYENPVRSAQ